MTNQISGLSVAGSTEQTIAIVEALAGSHALRARVIEAIQSLGAPETHSNECSDREGRLAADLAQIMRGGR